MKKTILFFLLFSLNFTFASDPPFSRGVNLTSWFQAGSPQEIPFSRYTIEDFQNIKSLGCDVIRLPINLHSMTIGNAEHTLDPLFFYFLDQVVSWAEEVDIHIILDNHTFDPAGSTDPDIGEILVPVWKQMAHHYKDDYLKIYYEILNEPHGIEDELWNCIQLDVLNSIREIDSIHTIIVGPAGWNSYNNLQYMPEYNDDYLIYTFHFYDPFIFTHQGASWTDPSLVPLSGVPFPYNESEMPECPPELIGTWIEWNLNDYHLNGTIAKVQELLDIAIDFKLERDVPLFCGEFGVYKPNSENSDRNFWYYKVRQYLEANNIAWTTWDYQGGFGLFEEGTQELFDYDLNTFLLSGLGLNIPPQSEYELLPDTIGFKLYDDYFGSHINSQLSGDAGEVQFYSDEDPHEGEFCIRWNGGSQYSGIRWDFSPDKDLTYLVESNHAISFWIKGNTPGTTFDIRFVDTDTEDIEDHPWRMRVVVDDDLVNFNNEWHRLYIPLAEFTEHGAWEDEWFPPQGDFDWAAVDYFEIIAEEHDLTDVVLQFDEIFVMDSTLVTVHDHDQLAHEFKLFQNYPNPFNPETVLNYSIDKPGFAILNIYSINGELIKRVERYHHQKGYYAYTWNSVNQNGERAASGIYIYQLIMNGESIQKKMTLLR
ncbi:MAG: cellulase family glycosylhydrolase [Melioribacteraceae bacterium]|nr:cellulase family glycosylhydrolase [Melioribacteraceae bacterium]MCF8355495.1 cellulase family glycosylhydrolase [Melioribacteraceae bacterium]MCF8394920.1 cellulase family glycosylhydrolase [Melioribacteraceae bacterium]MCF8420438.1 cellulase family glycosylhydrolase [Melioribacteraceae bacterium]